MSDPVAVVPVAMQGPPAYRPVVPWTNSSVPPLKCYTAPWATVVNFDGSLYECLSAHTVEVDAVFDDDRAAGKWGELVSARLSAEGLAASAAAVAAAASANADAAIAVGAATAATTAASQAVPAAATASAAATTAAGAASTATGAAATTTGAAAAAATSAGNAAVSETNAGGHASAAATSAASASTSAGSAAAAAVLAGSFLTRTAMDAAVGGFTNGQRVEVTADGANNGSWVKTAGAFVQRLDIPTGASLAASVARTSLIDVDLDANPLAPQAGTYLDLDKRGIVMSYLSSADGRHDFSGRTPVLRPRLFAWFSGIRIYRRPDRTVFSDYDHAARRPFSPSGGTIVYVDPAAAGGGTGSLTAPFNSLAALNGLTGNIYARIMGGTYPIAKLPGTISGPTNLCIEVIDGTGPAILTTQESGLVWTAYGAVAGCYQTTVATAPGSVADEGFLKPAVTDRENRSLFPNALIPAGYTKVTTDGALATPGTWRITGTTLIVHRLDGSAPTSAVRVYRGMTNFNFATSGTLWIKGEMHILGGTTLTVGTGITSPNRMKIHLNRVLMGYSAVDQNAYNAVSSIESYALACACVFGGLDGFNYHGASLAPYAFEERCAGNWNGLESGGANNGSTIHDAGFIIRIGGDYSRNQNRNVHDVANAMSWNVRCRANYAQVQDAVNHSGLGFYIGYVTHTTTPNARMWCDDCEAIGNLFDLGTGGASNGKLFTRNVVTDGTVEPSSVIANY